MTALFENITMLRSSINKVFTIGLLLFTLCNNNVANAQVAAWPATSYSPAFESFVARASAPVSAVPSGMGLQAPSIPVPGGAPAAAMPAYSAPAYSAPAYSAPAFSAPQYFGAPSPAFAAPSILPY